MADDEERVLELARAIRPYLADLVGHRAHALDRDLARLLTETSKATALAAIRDSLGEHEATRAWMASFLKTGLPPDVARLFEPRRGESYEDLAGLGAAVLARKYVCPYGDFVWYRRTRDQAPPPCPTHGVEMKPVVPPGR